MNVIFIRPPKYMIEGQTDIPIVPPLGIALIAGFLKNEGHKVTLIDAIAEAPLQYQNENIPVHSNRIPQGYKLITKGLSFQEISDRIPKDTDVIGLSCMFTINWPCDRALINFLKANYPNSVILAGGESVTGMAEQCLLQTNGLSICVTGEGEETTSELLKALDQKQPLETVSGIVFKSENGQIVKTQKRERISDLSIIPYPAWELLPIDNYQKHAVLEGEEPKITLSILATRGCPYQCTFCTSPDMWGTRYYMRKPEDVIGEIEYVKKNFGATNFEFFDLTAIIQKKWILEFAKLLVERNVNIGWKIPAGTRSEAIDEEICYWLMKSGCRLITYAPESGSPRMLKLIKKKVSLDNMMISMRAARKHDMEVFVNIILGLPDEMHKDIWKTIWFIFKCRYYDVSDISVFFFRPYPGSALFNRLRDEGIMQINKDDYIVDSIFITESLMEDQFYNSNVSPFWYKIYKKFIDLAFYWYDYFSVKGSHNIYERKFVTIKRKRDKKQSYSENPELV